MNKAKSTSQAAMGTAKSTSSSAKNAAKSLPGLAVAADGARAITRALPEEVPVAVTFNGTTLAVMMATPDDIADFAHGFALTEGAIATRDEVENFEIVTQPAGRCRAQKEQQRRKGQSTLCCAVRHQHHLRYRPISPEVTALSPRALGWKTCAGTRGNLPAAGF